MYSLHTRHQCLLPSTTIFLCLSIVFVLLYITFFLSRKKCNFYNTVIVYKEYSMLCTLDKAFLTLYFYLLVGLVANSSFQKASSLYRFDVPHCLMKKTYTTILIFLCQPFYKKNTFAVLFFTCDLYAEIPRNLQEIQSSFCTLY